MIQLFKSVPTGKELKALKAVLESGWWAQGSKVAEFEEAYAKFTGAKYAIATNSCTAALDIAVRIAPLPKKATVSAFTFVSSALCLYNADKRFEFVDINPHSLCTYEADIQVFYAGNDFGTGMIYDMAHAGGMKHKGLISCWSFHAVKNLPTGDGGMLTTNDPELARRARALAWCGIDKSTYARASKLHYSWDYNIEEAGIKGNMNDLTAAIGLEQLKLLPERNSYRKQVAAWYDQYLSPEVKRPYPSETWHMYVIRVPKRDMLYDRLAANHIQAGVHYKPLYKYPLFKQATLPNTEKAFREVITLPMHLELSEFDVKEICATVNDHISQS